MRRFKRDLDWPRHMKAKRLKTGVKAYYWQPHGRDISAGFTLHSEHWERTLRSLVTAPSSSTRISMPGERAKARQRASMLKRGLERSTGGSKAIRALKP